MANHQYQYLYILLIVLIQISILTIAKPIQHETTNSRSIAATVSDDHQDESYYPNENSGGEMYDEDEGDSGDIHSSAVSNSQNLTSHLNNNIPNNAYDDEDDDDDNEYAEESQVYGDRRSVDRPGSHRPTIDSTSKSITEYQTTSRMSYVPGNLWNDLFARPAILVGITGGIIIGMLSAILLVMFIIYRMRKKDEGSYVLEEVPRKSPSHAYTRVSSREFFA